MEPDGCPWLRELVKVRYWTLKPDPFIKIDPTCRWNSEFVIDIFSEYVPDLKGVFSSKIGHTLEQREMLRPQITRIMLVFTVQWSCSWNMQALNKFKVFLWRLTQTVYF